MLEVLENGMANYARLLPDGIVNSRGAGAAGGLGAALLGFLKAKLKPGIDAILDIVDFDRMLIDADLVITGEGRLDRSTMMGKAVSGILRRAQSRGVPVIAIGGSVDRSMDLSGFRAAYSVTPPGMSLETAMRPEIATDNIRSTIAYILKNSLFYNLLITHCALTSKRRRSLGSGSRSRSMVISLAPAVADKCANKQEQGRLGLVEVCYHARNYAVCVAGCDDDASAGHGVSSPRCSSQAARTLRASAGLMSLASGSYGDHCGTSPSQRPAAMSRPAW